jgi:hypothetical protein
MQRRTRVLLLISVILSCSSGALMAAEPSIGKDLTATIVLQGMPCDKVINSTRNSDSDYTASCQDGNRYHVYVDPNGRVIVKKL